MIVKTKSFKARKVQAKNYLQLSTNMIGKQNIERFGIEDINLYKFRRVGEATSWVIFVVSFLEAFLMSLNV